VTNSPRRVTPHEIVVRTWALTQKPEDEFRCLLPEECGPDVAHKLLCFLSEGCDTNSDGVPDLRAGEPGPDVEPSPGAVPYDNTL
jgi:hypothetical protein